jgi:hypothetical protein
MAWVRERFPVEKHSQAFVAFCMLRHSRGKGHVTLAMVKARMRVQDQRLEAPVVDVETGACGCEPVGVKAA